MCQPRVPPWLTQKRGVFGPFWGVLSKTSALRYVWRKTAIQIQCNPPQPRAKHTTPPHVIIAIWHHVHNNFIFPHDTFLDTQTTMRFCICVLEHLKANCDLFISVNYLLPPAALLRQPNGAVRVCCVVLRCARCVVCFCLSCAGRSNKQDLGHIYVYI